MAVPEQTPYIEHTGNGITTSFALGFQCETKDHLIVLVDDIEPPIATWSLTEGNVVFATAPAVGKKITLQRNTPFGRTTNYQSFNNSFRPQSVNGDFDRLWLKLQELGVGDWLLKLYVDRLHQQQEEKIDDLKNYVDDRDDELRSYLMEEIRKQGVALDQLDEYYNYLMQRLAQIAVDKGWDASFVVDGNKTQKEINRYTAQPFRYDHTYLLNERVQLANGVIVKNTIPENTFDPNVDMVGWIFNESYITPEQYGAVGDGITDDSAALIRMFSEIPEGSEVHGSGTYLGSNVPVEKNVTLVGGTYKSKMVVTSSPVGRYHIPCLVSIGGFDYIKGRDVTLTGEYISGGGAAVTDNRIGQLFKFENLSLVEFENFTLKDHCSNWNTTFDYFGHFVGVINHCKIVKIKNLTQSNLRIEGLMVCNFDLYDLDGYTQINSDAIWTPLHSFSYTGSVLIAKNIHPKAVGSGSTTNLKADNVTIQKSTINGGGGVDLGSEGDPSDVSYATLTDVDFNGTTFTIYQAEINGAGMKKLTLNNVNNRDVPRGLRILKCGELESNNSDLSVVKRVDVAENICYNLQVDDFEIIKMNKTKLKGGFNSIVLSQSAPILGPAAYNKTLVELNECDVDVNIASSASLDGKVFKLANINTATPLPIKTIRINKGKLNVANGNISGPYVGGGFSANPYIENFEITGGCEVTYKTGMTDAKDCIFHNLQTLTITGRCKIINHGKQFNIQNGATDSIDLSDIEFINDAVTPPARFVHSPVSLLTKKIVVQRVACLGALNNSNSIILYNNGAMYKAPIQIIADNIGTTYRLKATSLLGSFSYDPPSIPANGTTETTVTLIGASVGDPVSVAFSQYNAGIEVSAIVSAADTVLVRFKNTTGAAIDLPSGVINIKLG